eukprot:symbB.v1.2.025460.t1/scaffold2453.1/size78854/5
MILAGSISRSVRGHCTEPVFKFLRIKAAFVLQEILPQQFALTLEPRLGTADLDRLWGLIASSPELNIQQLLLFQGASNTDPWGESCLRRIARRLAPAMNSPANFFQRFNLTGSGMLSYAEFENMVLNQDAQLTREDVGALWRLADADGNGRVDLNEFVGLLRQAQIEGMTTSNRPQLPSTMAEQDMILEAHIAQMERSFRNRGVTLLQACQLMDIVRIGFLDRSGCGPRSSRA